MKPGKTIWRAVVSTLSMAILLLAYTLPAKAELMPDYFDGYDLPPEQYPYGTAWLTGLGVATGAVLASGLASDKKQHFALSIPLGAGGEYLLRQLNIASEDRWKRIMLATAIGLIPGLAKEMTDSKFDGGDLLADLAGSFTGALAADLYQGPVQPMLSFQLGKDKVQFAINHRF